jgi:hypothetical protein
MDDSGDGNNVVSNTWLFLECQKDVTMVAVEMHPPDHTSAGGNTV